ncbi:MAG: hypothetical protein CR975_03805 [Gammaproteobacteria bacterium]|nr:MAG: hypothetical protein CR975_03805 [Gammaproteobacteria bacterium]
MQTFLQQYLPKHYQQVSQQNVSVDGNPAVLTRYQNDANDQLTGEHFSTLFGQDKLQGFVWLAPQLVAGTLPNKQQAQDIADDFLRAYAPDLYANKELHWIKPHDETIVVAGKKQTITGMKVKMRQRQNGLWFWVIVGNNRQVIIFERDIVWLDFKFKRQTEKWLHDDWLVARSKR